MHAVVGGGPVAVTLASTLAAMHSTALVATQPVPGPFLWRAGDLETGEGLRAALHGVENLYVVLEDPHATAHGVLLALRRGPPRRGVVVTLLDHEGRPEAEGTTPWSRVRHPAAWGPLEPLVAAWSATVAEGRTVWVCDPGPIQVVSMPTLVDAVLAAARTPGADWVLNGAQARLPELAEAIGRAVGTPARTRRAPLRLVARRAGIRADRIRRWLAMPTLAPVCDLDLDDAGPNGWVSLPTDDDPTDA